MNWIQDNLQLLSTLGSALAVYIFIRKAARKEHDEMKVDVRDIKKNIQSIDLRIQSIDQRLSRLEDAFEERGRWQSMRTGTEGKE